MTNDLMYKTLKPHLDGEHDDSAIQSAMGQVGVVLVNGIYRRMGEGVLTLEQVAGYINPVLNPTTENPTPVVAELEPSLSYGNQIIEGLRDVNKFVGIELSDGLYERHGSILENALAEGNYTLVGAATPSDVVGDYATVAIDYNNPEMARNLLRFGTLNSLLLRFDDESRSLFLENLNSQYQNNFDLEPLADNADDATKTQYDADRLNAIKQAHALAGDDGRDTRVGMLRQQHDRIVGERETTRLEDLATQNKTNFWDRVKFGFGGLALGALMAAGVAAYNAPSSSNVEQNQIAQSAPTVVCKVDQKKHNELMTEYGRLKSNNTNLETSLEACEGKVNFASGLVDAENKGDYLKKVLSPSLESNDVTDIAFCGTSSEVAGFLSRDEPEMFNDLKLILESPYFKLDDGKRKCTVFKKQQ